MSDVSKVTSTLVVDGVEIKDGSPEAVEALLAQLREAYSTLNEATALIAKAPDDVEHEWRKLHHDAERKLSKLLGYVSHFADDYTKRGLDSALTDARWRKELR